MASCLWMYLCFFGAIFAFAATEDENITCTFTNGQDCSHLLHLNNIGTLTGTTSPGQSGPGSNATEYVIEKDAINRTGVKIIFDREQGVERLTISSGKELATRVQVINITRGPLTHLVNLSCSEKTQIDEIKLEPIVISKELQIDFVKGCGVDTDPIIINSIHSTFVIDEGAHTPNVSNGTLSSDKAPRKEETQTSAPADVSDEPGRTTWVPTLGDEKQQTEPEMPAEPSLEKSTVQSFSVFPSEGKKTVPTTSPTKMSLATSAGRSSVKDGNEIRNDPDEKINFKFDASKSSARKVSSDLATLFVMLVGFYKA